MGELERLLKGVQSWKQSKRIEAAKELAKYDDSRAKEALLAMAKGRRFSLFRKYGVDDQLTAIQTLAEYNDLKINAFLKDFLAARYTSQKTMEEDWYHDSHSTCFMGYKTCEHDHYYLPNCTGKLRDALTYGESNYPDDFNSVPTFYHKLDRKYVGGARVYVERLYGIREAVLKKIDAVDAIDPIKMDRSIIDEMYSQARQCRKKADLVGIINSTKEKLADSFKVNNVLQYDQERVYSKLERIAKLAWKKVSHQVPDNACADDGCGCIGFLAFAAFAYLFVTYCTPGFGWLGKKLLNFYLTPVGRALSVGILTPFVLSCYNRIRTHPDEIITEI